MRHRVIIVEDDNLIQEIMERFIMREGFEVISFLSPLDARNQIRNTDIVVTDIVFPDCTREEMEEFLCRCLDIGAAMIVHSGGNWEKKPDIVLLNKPVDIKAIISAVMAASKIDKPETFCPNNIANPTWHPEPPSTRMMKLEGHKNWQAALFWRLRRELDEANRTDNLSKRELEDLLDKYERALRRLSLRSAKVVEKGGRAPVRLLQRAITR